MRLTAKFTSTYCNTWPTVNLTVNNQIILNSTVVESLDFSTAIDISNYNTLSVSMIGKQFGPVWDTKLHNGEIIQDKTLSIKCFEFDDVDILPILNKRKMHVVDSGKNQRDDYIDHKCSFHFNSSLDLEFTTPIYNWIITEKFIKDDEYVIDDKSFGSWKNKFNYDTTREYLDKIQKLL
jgi:hypothetical protein